MLQNTALEGNFDIYFGINGWVLPQWEGLEDSYVDPYSDSDLLYDDVDVDRHFTMTLGGRISELDMKSIVDIKDALTSNLYLNIDGRKDEGGNRITNAIKILRDIILSQMSLEDDDIDEDIIDEDSYDNAFGVNEIHLAFSVNEFTTVKELFEGMSKSTLCFPHFKFNGKIGFPIIEQKYDSGDYNDSFKIKNLDIISYSFEKTAPEKIYSRVDVNYNYDYQTKEYAESVAGSYGKKSLEGITPLSMINHELSYYGYNSAEDNVLHFESKYIRTLENARKLADLLFFYNKNQHLKVKLKLPLKYIAVEIGSIISFEELIEGKDAYGMDYTKVTNNTIGAVYLEQWSPELGIGIETDIVGGETPGQFYYPIFFVQSTRIAYDYIEIEAVQLHNLSHDYYIDGWLGLLSESILDREAHPDWDSGLDFWDMEGGVWDSSITTFIVNPDSDNAFYTLEELSSNDISNWIEPISWELDSFDLLVPTDWTTYTGSEIRDYEALRLSIAYEEGGSFARKEFVLQNISNSTEVSDFELGWVGVGEENWFEQGFPILNLYSSYPSADKQHKVYIGDGLKKAFIYNLLSLEELRFISGYPIHISTGGYGLGDVNNDGTLNILDIVSMVNFIVYANQDEMTAEEFEAADVNVDSQVNILDILQLMNIMMEQ